MQAVAQKNTFVVVCQGEEARLQAVSEAERAEWVETIKRCIGKLAEVVAEPTVPALDLTTRSAQAMPAYRDELLWALRRVAEGYCEWQRKPEAGGSWRTAWGVTRRRTPTRRISSPSCRRWTTSTNPAARCAGRTTCRWRRGAKSLYLGRGENSEL